MADAYILVWRPDKFWLVGPFADAEAAFRWGSDEKNNPSNNPNWFVLPRVQDPRAPVEVVPPIEPMPDSTVIEKLYGQLYARDGDVDDDGLTDWEKRERRPRDDGYEDRYISPPY